MSTRAWSAPGWAALLLVGALALAAPGVAEQLRWLPFLLGLVLFSLSHGAVDHHVPRRLGAPGGARFLVGYCAAVALGLAAWALAPVLTLVAFLVVAAVHWGCGEAWFTRAVNGRAAFRGRADAVVFVAARGLLPVALPALAHPAEFARGADAILGAVGAGAAPVLSDGARAAGLTAIGAVVALAAASSLLRGASNRRVTMPGGVHRRLDVRARLIDVGELALLGVFFLVTPAVLAVGTYLLVWHAPRHVARLIAADPAQAALPPARALRAWHVEAAPLTLVSLAGLALLAATAWQVPATQGAVAGGALALIAALTFPHAAVVAWMDREQRVFATPPRASARSTAPRAPRPGGLRARRWRSAPG